MIISAAEMLQLKAEIERLLVPGIMQLRAELESAEAEVKFLRAELAKTTMALVRIPEISPAPQVNAQLCDSCKVGDHEILDVGACKCACH